MKKENNGWRLDYFIVSQDIIPLVEDIQVKKEINASDHVPLIMTMYDPTVFL